jgi:hypothetical protein
VCGPGDKKKEGVVTLCLIWIINANHIVYFRQKNVYALMSVNLYVGIGRHFLQDID